MRNSKLIVITRRLLTPDKIPGINIAAWFSTMESGSVILDGTTASQWSDISGNNRHVTQAIKANQPTYTPDGLNGKPVLTFTRSLNNFLQGSFPTIGISAINTFVVTRWLTTGTTTADIQTLIDNDHAGNPAQGWVLQDRPDLANRPLTATYLPPATNGAQDTEQTGNNVWKIIQGEFLSTVSQTLFVNGQQRGTLANTGAFNLRSIIRIGGGIQNSRAFNGEFAEILITTTALSTTHRQQFEGYLAWRRGLQANLVNNHPFKFSPPYI
jgi:hypothetical protein